MMETKAQVLAETATHALVLVQRKPEAPLGQPKGQLCVVVPTDRWTGDTVGSAGVPDEVVRELVRKHARAENEFFALAGLADNLKVSDEGVLSVSVPTAEDLGIGGDRGILPA